MKIPMQDKTDNNSIEVSSESRLVLNGTSLNVIKKVVMTRKWKNFNGNVKLIAFLGALSFRPPIIPMPDRNVVHAYLKSFLRLENCWRGVSPL